MSMAEYRACVKETLAEYGFTLDQIHGQRGVSPRRTEAVSECVRRLHQAGATGRETSAAMGKKHYKWAAHWAQQHGLRLGGWKKDTVRAYVHSPERKARHNWLLKTTRDLYLRGKSTKEIMAATGIKSVSGVWFWLNRSGIRSYTRKAVQRRVLRAKKKLGEGVDLNVVAKIMRDHPEDCICYDCLWGDAKETVYGKGHEERRRERRAGGLECRFPVDVPL